MTFCFYMFYEPYPKLYFLHEIKSLQWTDVMSRRYDDGAADFPLKLFLLNIHFKLSFCV